MKRINLGKSIKEIIAFRTYKYEAIITCRFRYNDIERVFNPANSNIFELWAEIYFNLREKS